jgi:hypothetical protein
MNQKQFERWAKTRQIGRTAHIWRCGVLGWGLPVGIIWAVAMAAIQGWDRLPILLPVALIGFPIGGYFFGVWTWRTSEKAYRKAMENKPDH